MARWPACLLLLAPFAAGGILVAVDDMVGDRDAVTAARDDPRVREFRAELDKMEAQLLKLKRRDLLAMFGKPALEVQGWEQFGQPKARHALPVAQARGLAISGEGDPDKDRVEFYGNGLEVYYLDDVTPHALVFWLPADAKLPRLGPDNLAARLQWDRAKWDDLVAAIEKRRAAAFPWVVDRDAETKFFEGQYSTDPAAKLAAWKALGEKLGYRCEEREAGEGRRTCWYRPDRTRVFEYADRNFTWYDESGRNELRGEVAGKSWHWYRPGGSSLIRSEFSWGEDDKRPHEWFWGDKAERLVRRELDDNADGIPDLFDGKLPAPATDDHEEEWRPLEMDRSWAVHPELIPPECRIEDQPDRRVPVRKAP